MNTVPSRIILFFLVFIGVVVLPWWISAFVLLCLTIYITLYLEVLFFGFLFDAMYSTGSFHYLSLFLAFILISIVSFIRPRIRT